MVDLLEGFRVRVCNEDGMRSGGREIDYLRLTPYFGGSFSSHPCIVGSWLGFRVRVCNEDGMRSGGREIGCLRLTPYFGGFRVRVCNEDGMRSGGEGNRLSQNDSIFWGWHEEWGEESRLSQNDSIFWGVRVCNEDGMRSGGRKIGCLRMTPYFGEFVNHFPIVCYDSDEAVLSLRGSLHETSKRPSLKSVRMEEQFPSSLTKATIVNGLDMKDGNHCCNRSPHYCSQWKKDLSVLENTVGGLVCSVDNMMEIIQGMAIHIEERDTKLVTLIDMVIQLQSCVDQNFVDCKANQLTPTTVEGKKRSSRPKSQSTAETKLSQTVKREAAIEKQDDKFTVIIDVSDDEDAKYRKKKKDWQHKVIKKGRPVDTKDFKELNNTLLVKKLSFTTTKEHISKHGVPEPSSVRGPICNAKVTTASSPSRGHVFPENMATNFKITKEMGLTIEEMYIAAFVFHPDGMTVE
ncbi:transglycosylase [Sesbania bispinosa]|nr:transglycosylase [Sesbania bispinosa]